MTASSSSTSSTLTFAPCCSPTIGSPSSELTIEPVGKRRGPVGRILRGHSHYRGYGPNDNTESDLLHASRNSPRRGIKTMMAMATMVGALALAGTASAATPIYWTPAHMAKALATLNYPPASQPIFTVACKGATIARKGTYAGFRCTVTYIGHTTARAYAKPLTQGRVCGSTVSLNACRPLAAGLLAGDPTVCLGATDPRCVAVNAKDAALARWKEQTGYGQPVPTCTSVSALVYSCKMYDGKVYTVTFTKGTSAWTTTVTP